MAKDSQTVLFIVPDLSGGGAERVITTVLRNLDRRRFRLHLALVRATGSYLSEVPSDVTVHDLRVSRTRYAGLAMLRLAWRIRPQVILSTVGYLNLYLLLIKWMLPPDTVLIVRESNTVSAILGDPTQMHSGLFRILYRLLYRRADVVLCQSDYMLQDLYRTCGIPTSRMVRIYNPVDEQRVQTLAAAEQNPFREPGPNIVAIGRLVYQKAFDLLIEAFAIAHRQYSTCHLWVLGEGPLHPELQKQAARLGLEGYIHFTGFVKNPYAYISHSDVVVQSSRYEGLPNVVIESLLLGASVVATDCPGGIREVITKPGLGILTDLTADSISSGIKRVLSHEAGLIKPRERAVEIWERFGVRTVMAEYETLLLNPTALR